MGFMKFRGKEDNLDIPPPPPFPSQNFQPRYKQPDLPPPPMPEMREDDNMSEDTFPEHMLPPEQSDKPLFGIPPISASLQEPQKRSFDDFLAPNNNLKEEEPEENYEPSPILSDKQVFVEVGRYKNILKDLRNIKKSLKQTDDQIKELIGDFTDEEKVFSGLHADLSEVESKLAELDNLLFS